MKSYFIKPTGVARVVPVLRTHKACPSFNRFDSLLPSFLQTRGQKSIHNTYVTHGKNDTFFYRTLIHCKTYYDMCLYHLTRFQFAFLCEFPTCVYGMYACVLYTYSVQYKYAHYSMFPLVLFPIERERVDQIEGCSCSLFFFLTHIVFQLDPPKLQSGLSGGW